MVAFELVDGDTGLGVYYDTVKEARDVADRWANVHVRQVDVLIDDALEGAEVLR